MVYTTYYSTRKPRYISYRFSEERTMDDGIDYFYLEYYYLDFDTKTFGEVTIELGISKFRGTKRIDSLGVFPLEYYLDRIEV